MAIQGVPWVATSSAFTRPKVCYLLERSTNLAATPPFTTLVTNLPGQPGTTTCTDSNPPVPGPWFYRVGVQS